MAEAAIRPVSEAAFADLAKLFCEAAVGNNATELRSVIKQLCFAHPKGTPLVDCAQTGHETKGDESQRVPEILLESALYELVFAELISAGFNVCGRGDDAIALSREDLGWVVRLGQNQRPFTNFVSLTQKMSLSAFPEFYGHASLDQLCISIVETLAHIPLDDNNCWAKANKAAALAYCIVDGRPVSECLDALNTELENGAKALGQEARRLYYALDLSAENIMCRPSTGEIVFNDPWSPWGEG